MYGIALVAMLFGSPVLAVSAQDASPVASPVSEESSLLAELGYPTLELTTTDGSDLDVPTEIEAGRYHVIFNNQSESDIDLEVYQLPEGMTTDDLVALFEEAFSGEGPPQIPEVFYDIVFNGGVSTFAGETGEVVLDLAPGEWTLNLYSFDEATGEDSNIPTTVNVTGEMPEVENPADVVEIGMGEMYFEVSGEIVAGPQVWQLVGEGQQPHHLILSGVPEGTTVEQVLELAASDGPPASPEASPVTAASPAVTALSIEDVQDVFYSLPLSGGQTNFVALDVEPGTYAMICFLPAPDGTPHVMLGMVEIVVVD
jgi:hypothetical protein